MVFNHQSGKQNHNKYARGIEKIYLYISQHAPSLRILITLSIRYMEHWRLGVSTIGAGGRMVDEARQDRRSISAKPLLQA